MTQGAGPVLARTRAELDAALAAQDGDGGGRRRGVVMTMGALHEGHLDLVRAARAAGGPVVVTIFVNPLQFSPREDLSRYPRDLDRDLRLLTGPGLLGDGDVVFAPTPEVVYPGGDPGVRVAAGPLGEVLEGAVRPGHFDGVLTVVLKLLHLTRPAVAYFGRKDAQQLATVRAMVRDLDVPVRVEAVGTAREVDGLARSSRNAYLGPEDRRRAAAVPAALEAAVRVAAAGGDAGAVLGAAADVLDPAVDATDYVALVDPETFRSVPDDLSGEARPALLVLAVRLGGTRLLDNTELTLRPLAGAGATGAGRAPVRR